MGGSGRDDAIGGPGRDEIEGDRGGDELDGANGTDRLRGGADDDVLIHGVGPARDLLDGDRGADAAYAGSGDRVLQARRARADACPAGFSNACITFVNASSQDAQFDPSTSSGCAGGSLPPRTVAANSSEVVQCAANGGTATLDFTVDGGDTSFSVAVYLPDSQRWKPSVACNYVTDAQAGAMATTCIPDYTGSTDSQTSTVTFEPVSANPSGMGAGLDCVQTNGAANPCAEIGPLQSSDSGGATLVSQGEDSAVVGVFPAGSTTPSDSQTVPQIQTWSPALDPGARIELLASPGADAAIELTQVISWGGAGGS